MPKLFPIHIEVEELAVGKVMRLLNKTPGVARFNLDLDRERDEVKTKPNGAHRAPIKRVQLEHSGNETAAKALFRKSPQTTGDLRAIFQAEGRSPHSINSVLHNMKRAGDVKTTPDGWILTKKARDRVRHHMRGSK